jgi:squalene-hopene/tetraprenyl-beta-curcumene cyclase
MPAGSRTALTGRLPRVRSAICTPEIHVNLSHMRLAVFAFAVSACFVASGASSAKSPAWNGKSAAAYLDYRADWWSTWDRAQRDHGTFCTSCHTSLSYAMARPALRSILGESGPSEQERKMIANITTRVRGWNDMLPFYNERSGPGVSRESRGVEAVLNALVLTSYDSSAHRLGDDASLALKNMWSLQSDDGSWPWFDFHNGPWENETSPYWGATLGVLAVSFAPADYRARPEVREKWHRAVEYLKKNRDSQIAFNKIFLLYAAARTPDLLRAAEKKSILDELRAKQQDDGGWTLSALIGDWKRKDKAPLETKSDGYATGLVAYALEQSAVRRNDDALKRGIVWLTCNQDQTEGFWTAWSVNKQRNSASEIGRFMVDAATAYAVLALTSR